MMRSVDPGVLPAARPPAERASGASRLVQLVRVGLVLCTLMAIGSVLWQHPRTGTIAGFRHDLVGRRATSVEIVTSDKPEIAVGKPWRAPDRTPHVPYVRWVTSDHRVHDAPIGDGGFPSSYFDGTASAADGVTHPELLPAGARKDLAAWWDGPRSRSGHLTVSLLPLFALLSTVLLVAGPPTRRGTKWAWFWFAGLAPLGLGILLWLAVESPWSRRLARALGGHPPGPAWLSEQRSGWAGLGWGLVAWIGAQVLFRGAAAIL